MKRIVLVVTCLLAGIAALAGGWLVASDRAAKPEAVIAPAGKAGLHAVKIRRPDGPPRVATGRTNLHGEAVFASCASCHTTTKPNSALRRSTDLKEFHLGLTFQHGDLSCLSCHNAGNYDALRLADGSAVTFSDVMQLCGQCHGPQLRDYRNGAHGGMSGHWDLTKGGRTRNNCVDCHDPHAPAYPQVMPAFKPASAGRNTH